jgi:integrase/recombinase XerD
MTTSDSVESVIPVDYATAVERFLAGSSLAPASRRVYRIALCGWAWSLVARTPPAGRERRGAEPPMLALCLLDAPDMARRVAAGFEARRRESSPATATRELSILRSALGWWRARGWLAGDPTAGLGDIAVRSVCGHAGLDDVVTVGSRAATDTASAAGDMAREARVGTALAADRSSARRLTATQVEHVLALRVALRESVLWRLLLETGVPAIRLLALNVPELRHEPRRITIDGTSHVITPATSQLLGWLVAGRVIGPVFLTERRAGPRVPARDRCDVTGRARLSYRRAAEIFTAATRPLDPAGHGWTLHQLSAAHR